MTKFEKRETEIDGLFLIKPKVFKDSRGYFFEAYNKRDLSSLGIEDVFVQDNRSYSKKGVLRGLHIQSKRMQSKLVSVSHGSVYDVAVDLRAQSSTFGQYFGIIISAENKLCLYIPNGFAHGFLVLSETAELLYKVSEYYYPEYDSGVIWNDPDIAIDWPLNKTNRREPLLSEKDRKLPTLKKYIEKGD